MKIIINIPNCLEEWTLALCEWTHKQGFDVIIKGQGVVLEKEC